MRFITDYWKTILTTLIIIVLSFARFPSLEQIPKVTNWDKIVHFLMYAGLTVVVMWDYDKESNKNNEKWRFFLLCLAFPLFMGMFTEILQHLIASGRHGDIYDWISNTVGVFVGWGIFVVYKRSFKT
ncbi:MAG: VanZ family protein [Paludibacter sp.]|nr:VanZ family protein [Paludibacter sp.]MDD4198527.1 VanZ family protein [Paludibacter sp.]MDD4427991.1 VanZ family protein [Paludibacter sp.]